MKMEIESSPPEVAKKLWNIVRIVFYMVRKGLSKSKIMVDLHLMMKRGKLAGKAIANNIFLHQYHSSFSCRSNDALNFVSPREYEFSCSNSPSNPFNFNHKRNRHHHHHHHHHWFAKSTYQYDDVATVSAVQKVLEIYLNNNNNNSNDVAVEASPLVSLPGFGKSPLVRQLRITDSPFPLKDEQAGDGQVDKEAEEFIKRFYKDLKLQKRMAALESPAHNIWSR